MTRFKSSIELSSWETRCSYCDAFLEQRRDGMGVGCPECGALVFEDGDTPTRITESEPRPVESPAHERTEVDLLQELKRRASARIAGT
ncbi:MAG TPA: hypothetical protein VJT73_20390 [Polyangiaceae bacterium]|nr:hypothetical protein [Polyangiaceae bacterium]